MPTIFRIGRYRFFFNSREETRRHVHIETPDGTAKFWIEPLVSLVNYYNIPEHELADIEKIIKEKCHDFINEWNKHFGI